MGIKRVTVNHIERNYFGDYDELRSDTMALVSGEKVARAIDKMVRRHARRGEDDCLFIENDDATAWRLCYDYDPELAKEGVYSKVLRIRHYTRLHRGMGIASWDTEETTTATAAKRLIVAEEATNC